MAPQTWSTRRTRGKTRESELPRWAGLPNERWSAHRLYVGLELVDDAGREWVAMTDDRHNNLARDADEEAPIWLYIGGQGTGENVLVAELHGQLFWCADAKTLLRRASAHLRGQGAWVVYAEQGYGKGVFVGSIAYRGNAEGLHIEIGGEICPRTRFLYCEHMSLNQLDMMSELGEKHQDSLLTRRVSQMLKACALDCTSREECIYTYTDDDVAYDMAKAQASLEVQRRSVVYPLTLTALITSALLYWILKLALLPGALSVVVAVAMLMVLPVVAAYGGMRLIRMLREPAIVRTILTSKLPVGHQLGEHRARFSWGIDRVLYMDEGSDLSRPLEDIETMDELERYMVVHLKDGTIFPVSLRAL